MSVRARARAEDETMEAMWTLLLRGRRASRSEAAFERGCARAAQSVSWSVQHCNQRTAHKVSTMPILQTPELGARGESVLCEAVRSLSEGGSAGLPDGTVGSERWWAA